MPPGERDDLAGDWRGQRCFDALEGFREIAGHDVRVSVVDDGALIEDVQFLVGIDRSQHE
jgi:hypothetical protein